MPLLTLLFDCDILFAEKADISVTGKVPTLVLPVETSAIEELMPFGNCSHSPLILFFIIPSSIS